MRHSLLYLILLLIACQNTTPPEAIVEAETSAIVETPKWSDTELELIAAVEHFIVVVGNFDVDKLKETFAPFASIGANYVKDSSWTGETMSFSGYLERVEQGPLRPYYEPVINYTIHVSEDQLAFVKADAILHSFGVPRSVNTDFFTLMKMDGTWKIVNGSYTAKKLPKEEQVFSMEAFARSYAQVWSGVRPEFVAMFFEENGELTINDGEPARGREGITEVARSFMTDLPDMQVRYDSLVTDGEQNRFHWTLIATNTGPGGTGNKVNVSGYEEWIFGKNGLVQSSQGHFPSEEYERQLKGD